MNEKSFLPFFVYGTLLPHQPNYHLWGKMIDTQSTAVFVNGRLHDMGYYPMLIEATKGYVHGMLMWVLSDAYTEIVDRLDMLEGFDPREPEASAYRRVQKEVQLADGRWQQAWVYLGHPDYVVGRPIILSGNWARYIVSQQIHIATWWDDTTTVAGLHEKEDDVAD